MFVIYWILDLQYAIQFHMTVVRDQINVAYTVTHKTSGSHDGSRAPSQSGSVASLSQCVGAAELR
jgi:hypothetical protein